MYQSRVDLTRVKSKILFGLTKRQLICFGAAALIGVPSFFLLRQTGNTSLAAMCMIVIMLPLFFLAMYERDGQPLEVIAKHFIDARMIRPKIRPYETENYYSALLRQYQVEKEVQQIVWKKENKARCENAAASVTEGTEADQDGCGSGA